MPASLSRSPELWFHWLWIHWLWIHPGALHAWHDYKQASRDDMKAFHVRAVGRVKKLMQMDMILLRGDIAIAGMGCSAGSACITLWRTAIYGNFHRTAHS